MKERTDGPRLSGLDVHKLKSYLTLCSHYERNVRIWNMNRVAEKKGLQRGTRYSPRRPFIEKTISLLLYALHALFSCRIIQCGQHELDLKAPLDVARNSANNVSFLRGFD